MLRNNHSDLTKEIREKVMDKFSTKIQNSRLDENDRRAIILSALNGYLKQVEQDQAGAAMHTFCRPRVWSKEENKKDWFKEKEEHFEETF